MLGGNRKRPSGPGSKKGKEEHGNAAPWGPLNSMEQVDRQSYTPLHSAYEAEAVGTGSDMTVKNTGT